MRETTYSLPQIIASFEPGTFVPFFRVTVEPVGPMGAPRSAHDRGGPAGLYKTGQGPPSHLQLQRLTASSLQTRPGRRQAPAHRQRRHRQLPRAQRHRRLEPPCRQRDMAGMHACATYRSQVLAADRLTGNARRSAAGRGTTRRIAMLLRIAAARIRELPKLVGDDLNACCRDTKGRVGS